MKLIKLSVYKNNELIRAVPFKNGLNLIVNSISQSGGTGNSVGKSTPSRLLDYLFLSSGEDIYTEAEFGKPIPDVYRFINENTIYVELEIEGFDLKEHKIGRTLTTDPKSSVYYLDSKVCSGLIPPDTLMRDNNRQPLRCHYDSETQLQTVPERI